MARVFSSNNVNYTYNKTVVEPNLYIKYFWEFIIGV